MFRHFVPLSSTPEVVRSSGTGHAVPEGARPSSLRPSLALPAEGTSRHPGPPRRDRGGPGCLLAQARDASRPRSAWPPLRLAGSRLRGRRRLRGFFLLVEESGELGLLAGGQVTVDDAPGGCLVQLLGGEVVLR